MELFLQGPGTFAASVEEALRYLNPESWLAKSIREGYIPPIANDDMYNMGRVEYDWYRTIVSAAQGHARSYRPDQCRCKTCGAGYHVRAHHENYLKPLQVRYLCDEHHAEVHGCYLISGLYLALMEEEWLALRARSNRTRGGMSTVVTDSIRMLLAAPIVP